MYARGTIGGITRGTKREHIIRAAQESIAFQSADLASAMERDTGTPLTVLKADGGASRDSFLMQFQADILGAEVVKPMQHETTALGVARLAGLTVGVWQDENALTAAQEIDKKYQPQMPVQERERRLCKWHRAVERSLAWEEP